jgi:hypothetical protein
LKGYLQTGQRGCYDSDGKPVPCPGSGQDGELCKGLAWPDPRFLSHGPLVEDRLTGLSWSRHANPAEFPLTWQEALDYITGLNREAWLGHGDWRLPNRHELRSLLSAQTRRPALPQAHPFHEVFPGWYWTSTSVALAPDHAWYVNLDGARTFFGGKDQSFCVWPVRGDSPILPQTGQRGCHDAGGAPRDCTGSGEDGERRSGRPWPEPRLVRTPQGLEDRLSGLLWHPDCDATAGPVTWWQALASAAALGDGWRLPNINELDSLVDCTRADPALPEVPDGVRIQPGYWSSSTSLFEPDWAWALYSASGGIGVGQKRGRHFHVWVVRDLSGG